MKPTPTLSVSRLESRDVPALLFVTTATDSASGSLRDVVSKADWGDTIRFDSALAGQQITLNAANASGVNGGQIVLNKSVTIEGLGQDKTTIRGASADGGSVFLVSQQATVEFSKMSIVGGRAVQGGGICSAGTVTLRESIVQANTALRGGGVFSVGTFTIVDSRVTGNTAAALDGKGSAYGGGIWAKSILNLSNVQIDGNTVSARGDVDSEALGGGIYAESLWLNASVASLDANTATSQADGNHSAQAQGGGLFLRGSSAALANVWFSLNVASAESNGFSRATGGAIDEVDAYFRLSGSRVAANAAVAFRGDGGVSVASSDAFGGAIHAQRSAADVQNAVVIGNQAKGKIAVGGGVSVEDGSVTAYGSLLQNNWAVGSVFARGGGAGVRSGWFGGDRFVGNVDLQAGFYTFPTIEYI